MVPGTWLLQGGSVGGRRDALDLPGAWRRGQDAGGENGTSQLYELDREAEMVSPGADGVVFLPYMAGRTFSHLEPRAKVFFGLDYSKTRGHMIRAAMEWRTFPCWHNLQVAEEAGVRVSQLRQGGAANSRLWTQMKAGYYWKENPGSRLGHRGSAGSLYFSKRRRGALPKLRGGGKLYCDDSPVC